MAVGGKVVGLPYRSANPVDLVCQLGWLTHKTATKQPDQDGKPTSPKVQSVKDFEDVIDDLKRADTPEEKCKNNSRKEDEREQVKEVPI
jgi:hypothetical protein